MAGSARLVTVRVRPNPHPHPHPDQGTNVGEEVVAALLRLDDKFIKLEDIPRIRDLVPTAEVRVRVRVIGLGLGLGLALP